MAHVMPGPQQVVQRWRAPRLLAATAAVMIAGCISERAETSTEPEIRQDTLVEVRLTDFAFTPANLVIRRGTRVRWVNTTNTFHTVTPEGQAEWQRWPTSVVADTFAHVFTRTGEFAYFCEPHRTIGMTGSITVQ